MKLQSIFHALLLFGAGVALADTTRDVSGPHHVELDDPNVPIEIRNNYGGWVNPEDFLPMPQCIAQQDHSAWLNAMTRCTRHRCTKHFIFCTHYQWLTQLSCLSAEFSPATIDPYVEYCTRSVLAKAQLAQWIQHTTGRDWLIHVGDTIGLHNLAPRSLIQGYKAVSIAQKAPECLRKATSITKETFEYVMGSCGFTSTTFHIGNAARPWEYSTSQKSMTALSFDTAGYDLTGRHIPLGEYFDKECFCSHFATTQENEPCLDQLDLTKERLWLHAICGPSHLPENWKKSLRIFGKDYIPRYRWSQYLAIPNMPPNVTALSEQCQTEACNTDSEGFCQVEPAIDRSCICGKLDYSLCQGACQNFESRKQYVEWLLTLCDDVKDWHGLPKNWHEILVPQPVDMIPWDWNLHPEHPRRTNCGSYTETISAFVFVNLVTILAVYLGERLSRSSNNLESHSKGQAWALKGLILASVQLAGSCINVQIIQSTPGCEDVPVFQLLLLWCSLPRLGWLVIAPDRIHRPEANDLATACSGLYAEALLQTLNIYLMTTVVTYGLWNGFYFGVLPNTEVGYSAWLMYGGALLWLFVAGVIFIVTTRFLRPIFADKNFKTEDLSKCGSYGCTGTYSNSSVRDHLLRGPRTRSSQRSGYGTLPVVAGPSQPLSDSREPHTSLYVVLSLGLPALFLAQTLFWVGFIRVSGANFCPPSPETITGVWAVSSLAAVALKFIM
ncbi:hypothetical protein FLONG3_10574 [Fusarium longipes]|uniref:Uncharacterized protein n=1 Tax=Fusarium longipes TaxID=694270 RepID=A0A395RMH8_9HYPO|nr:hypothetical protein FLONG3_10574 [Fusarium longipes]